MNYKEITKQTYNNNAREFDEIAKKLVARDMQEQLSAFVQELKGSKVLDLGSGPGTVAHYLKSRGFDTLCFDISEEMIKLCQEKGLEAQLGDMEDLQFPEKTFDGVWAATSLIHTPKSKISPILNNIKDIVKINSPFYISLKEGEGEGFVKSNNYEGERFFALYQQEEIEDKLQEKFYIKNKFKKTVGQTTFLGYICINPEISTSQDVAHTRHHPPTIS